MRRSFRLGLRFGVLVGIIVALVKVLQSRRDQPATGTEPWSRDSASWTPPPPPAEWAQPPAAPAVTPPPAPVDPAPPAPVDSPPPAPPTPADAGSEPAVDNPPPQADAAAVITSVDPGLGEEIAELSPPPPPAPPRAAPVKKARKAAKVSKAAKTASWPAEAWIEPAGTTCPNSHPVKAKLSSRIFHLPGMFAYERTRPDRCYSDAASAEADGFTRAKR